MSIIVIASLLLSQSFSTNTLKLGTTDACRPEDGFFKCQSSNQCIRRFLVKEGGRHCSDGSDEGIDPLNCSDEEEFCRGTQRCVPRYLLNDEFGCELNSKVTFPCREGEEFQCSRSKLCVPRSFVNNGFSDCSTMLITDHSDETKVLPSCLLSEFSCRRNGTLRCIPREWVGDGQKDCDPGIDETTVVKECDNLTEFRCKSSGRCIRRHRVRDGFADCPDGDDEVTQLPCIPTREFPCRDTGRCIPRSWRGNKLINCKDGSDENPMPTNDACVHGEFRCHNNKRCIPKSLVCDGMNHCGDCSDEIESCADPRMFRCPTNTSICVHWAYSCDAYSDCPQNSDDFISMLGFKCNKDVYTSSGKTKRYCSIPQFFLDDNYANCDDESDVCYRNGTYACSFCLNNQTAIARGQICDGVIDCPDFSDECLCAKNLKTSKRSQELCDHICYGTEGSACSNCKKGEIWCAYDGTCISSSKICDQQTDCPLSELDEKYCSRKSITITGETLKDFKCDPIPPELIEIGKKMKLEALVSQSAPEKATRCNGITECFNFEDECSERSNCSRKPAICDEIPLVKMYVPYNLIGNSKPFVADVRKCGVSVLSIAVGTSICNGVVDCSSKIDERNCSDIRFACRAGTIQSVTGSREAVSIPLRKYCDGVYPPDCIDQSDETNCSEKTHFYCENGDPLFVQRYKVLDGKRDCSDFSDECPPNLFAESALSSRDELIKSSFLKIMIWIMMISAVNGNVAVMLISFTNLKRIMKKPQQSRSNVNMVNNLLILNLACADFLMGVVLLTVGVKTTQFSGNYCHEDKTWRASSHCSAIGVMTVLSSESSVLTLLCMASYRCYVVFKPFESRSIKLRVLLCWITLIWVTSFVVALVPLAESLSTVMVTRMLTSDNPFFSSDTITFSELNKFSVRIQHLKTFTTHVETNTWQDVMRFLKTTHFEYIPENRGFFGYYSHSGVCMPKLYRVRSDDVGSNALSSVVITFNFIALLYIALMYLAIYKRTTGNAVSSSTVQRQKQAGKISRKITLLIVTNMCCWMPVCVMTFISMSGVVLNPLAYAISAVVLLPINSSLNPVIYTVPVGSIKKQLNAHIERIRQKWLVFRNGDVRITNLKSKASTHESSETTAV